MKEILNITLGFRTYRLGLFRVLSLAALMVTLSSCPYEKGYIKVSGLPNKDVNTNTPNTPPLVLVYPPDSIQLAKTVFTSADTLVDFSLILNSSATNDYAVCITNTICNSLDYVQMYPSQVNPIQKNIGLFPDGAYTIYAKGINGSNESSVVSKIFTVDTMGPSPGTINLSVNKTSNNFTTPSITYTGTAADSFFLSYCLGSSAGDCSYVAKNTITNGSNPKTYTGLSLPDGNAYLTVFDEDSFNNVTQSSKAYEVDTTGPANVSGFVLDYTSSSNNTRSPSPSFTPPTTPDFQDTYVCLGTSPTACDIKPQTVATGTGSSGNYFTGLSLSIGTYYFIIWTQDNVGNLSTLSSIAFNII